MNSSAHHQVCIQWSGSQSGAKYPFLPGFNFPNTKHHTLSHPGDNDLDGTRAGADRAKIAHWHVEQLAYLLGKLQATKEGDGTLLDHTAVVWTSEMGEGSHARGNIPFLMAGSARGAFKRGVFVDPGGRPHQEFMTGLARGFGVSPDGLGLVNGAYTGFLA